MAIPIVRCVVVVPLAPAKAFDLFARRLNQWWPLATHSLGLHNAVSCHMEPEAGGRIYERTAEGMDATWGTVLECREPERIVIAWHPARHPSTAQDLRLRFVPEGAGTRVELEQDGWERFGEHADGLRDRYEKGWPDVLARYFALANSADPAQLPRAPTSQMR